MNSYQCKSDVELAGASTGADGEALRCLYEDYGRRVYSLCLRVLGDTAEAEALTRDVFISAHHRARTTDAGSSLAIWLQRLTVKAILRHLKQKHAGSDGRGARPSATEHEHQRDGRVLHRNRSRLETAIAHLPPLIVWCLSFTTSRDVTVRAWPAC